MGLAVVKPTRNVFSCWIFHWLRFQILFYREKVSQTVSSVKIREGLQLGKAMVKEVATLSSIYISLLTDLTAYILEEFHVTSANNSSYF